MNFTFHKRIQWLTPGHIVTNTFGDIWHCCNQRTFFFLRATSILFAKLEVRKICRWIFNLLTIIMPTLIQRNKSETCYLFSQYIVLSASNMMGTTDLENVLFIKAPLTLMIQIIEGKICFVVFSFYSELLINVILYLMCRTFQMFYHLLLLLLLL